MNKWINFREIIQDLVEYLFHYLCVFFFTAICLFSVLNDRFKRTRCLTKLNPNLELWIRCVVANFESTINDKRATDRRSNARFICIATRCDFRWNTTKPITRSRAHPTQTFLLFKLASFCLTSVIYSFNMYKSVSFEKRNDKKSLHFENRSIWKLCQLKFRWRRRLFNYVSSYRRFYVIKSAQYCHMSLVRHAFDHANR